MKKLIASLAICFMFMGISMASLTAGAAFAAEEGK